MSYLRLQTQIINNWQFTGTSAILRIFSSQQFFEATTGELVPQGQVNNIHSCYQEYACTVSGTTLTIPAVTIATTTDSTVPSAVYTAVIYSPQDSPIYYLLSQFTVDPSYFQVEPQSATEVTGAGTGSAIGVYTERGVSGGKNYYNAQSEIDSTSLSAIVYASGSGEWRIKDAAGVNLYIGTENVAYPWDVVTWSAASGSLPVPVVAEYATVLSSTWENLILSNQAFAVPSLGSWGNGPFWNIAQTKQYVSNLVGDGTTPYAAELVIGKTALTVDPDLANFPIAIGANDPTFLALTSAVYVASYGCNQAGLDAALAFIGSDDKQLIITCDISVTDHTVIPANVNLTFESQGKFTVAGGKTVTVGLMTPAPSMQIFAGTGNVIFDESAVPYLDVTWWAGASPHSAVLSTAEHAFAQVKSSVVAGNGPVELGNNVWMLTDFVFPDDSIWNGVGNSTNAGDGTVLKLRTLTIPLAARAVCRIEEDFRNIVLNNFTIDVGSSDAASCFIASGSVPNSGINCQLNGVTFRGTATTSPPQTYIFDADNAHGWECINVQFNHCQWSTPEDTKSFHLDTVNSLIYFNGRQANNSKDGIFGYLEYAGWITDDTPDNRGVAGLVPIVTTDRTIKCSIGSGSKNATVTTGTVSLNDVGAQVVFDDGTVSTNYITGITSATTFTVQTNSPHTYTTADTDVNYYSPDTDGALAVWYLINGHNTLQINNNTDEGYQYFLVNNASDNLSPVNINGGIIQSIVQFNAAMVMNVTGCRLTSQLFEDPNGVQATLSLYGNSMSSTSLWGVVLLAPTPWGFNNGTSMVPVNFNYGFNGGSFANYNQQFIEVPTWFLQSPRHPGTLSTPLQGTYASDITTGGPHKALIGWGRTEPTSGIPDYYYWLARDYDTGFTLFVGNQAFPYRGYEFDATVYAQTFNGQELTPATITSNQNDYIPSDSSYFYRLATNASRNITGLALSGTSLLSELGGEKHEIWNVGTHNIVLKFQDVGSAAANRFLTDTGVDITVLPNERVVLAYDGTVSRWRASKLNTTGVLSDGTTITTVLPVVMEQPLEVEGIASFTDEVDITLALEVGQAFDFHLDFQPSSSTTGVAIIGNPGSHAISLDENTDIMTLQADTIEILGATAVTGTVNVSAGIRESGAQGIGYGTGAGGTVTQGSGSGKATTVVLNKVCGLITMDNAALNADTIVTFALTNSCIATTDQLIITHQSGGTVGKYIFNSQCGSGTANINVTNISTGNLSEAIVLRFNLFKSVSS